MSSKLTGYPRHNPLKRKTKKPPESGGFCCVSIDRRLWPLEPFRAAAVPARPTVAIVTIPLKAAIAAAVAVTAIHVALVSPMSPAVSAEPALHVGQDGEAAFLAVVEGLVERIRRVRDTLHRRRRARHGLGTVAQARHRIVRFLGILGIIALRIHPRVGAIDPQFCEIPHRGLDRRPQFFLVGVE